MNINKKFAIRATAALSLGTLMMTTACTDYAQEFKDDENNKVYAESDPVATSSSSFEQDSLFDTPIYPDNIDGEQDLVVWQGVRSGDDLSAYTVTGELPIFKATGCAIISMKGIGSVNDGTENILAKDTSESATRIDGDEIFDEETLNSVIRYNGGLAGEIANCEDSSEVQIILPIDGIDLENYNSYILNAQVDSPFDVAFAKYNSDEHTIESYLIDTPYNYYPEGKFETYENHAIYIEKSDGIHVATAEERAPYNSIVLRLHEGKFLVTAIALHYDPYIEEEISSSSSSSAVCSAADNMAGNCFHWDYSDGGYINFGGIAQDLGYWLEENDSVYGGKSKIVWPVALGNEYADWALDGVIENCQGVCGTASLDKGTMTINPYTSLYTLVAGKDDSGEKELTADATKWGGICITYSSDYSAELIIASDSIHREELQYDLPQFNLPKNAAEYTTKDISWSSFKQEGWGPVKTDGEAVAKILSRITFKIQAASGSTSNFNIKEIGSLGTCGK